MSAQQATLRSRTIAGFSWSLVGSAAQAGLQLGTLAVLARLLSPVAFGEVAAGLTIIGIGSIIALLGVGPALVQLRRFKSYHARTGNTLSLLMGFALAAICVATAGPAARFFHLPSLESLLTALALSFPLRSFGVVAEATLQRELRFRALSAIDVASFAIGYAGVGITTALLGHGAWALVLAHLGQMGVRSALLIGYARAPMGLALHSVALRRLLRFGGGLTIAQLAHAAAVQADQVVVGRFLGPLALGQYSRASQLVVMPASLLANALDRVLFPAMAQVRGDAARLRQAYLRAMSGSASIMIPAGFAIALAAPEIVSVLLGERWAASAAALRVLAAGLVLRTGFQLGDSLARATGAVYASGWRQAAYAVAVTGGAVLGSRWGISGVAAGVLGALSTKYLLMAHLSSRLTTASVRDLVRAHSDGAALGLIVLTAGYGSLAVLRDAGAAPVVRLLGFAAFTSVVVVAAVVGWPALLRGPDSGAARAATRDAMLAIRKALSADPVIAALPQNEANRP